MGLPCAAAFTDTYLPTVNGVTYTVQTWHDQWRRRGGSMPVVYPGSDGYAPADEEYPVPSVPFPFYDGFKVGLPSVSTAMDHVDIVHAHTPFSLGLGGLWQARKRDLPLVASYHTPTAEYAEYLALNGAVERAIRRCATAYERWFFDRASVVLAPSERARDRLRTDVSVSTPVEIVPNGVDTDRFRPVDSGAFRERHGIPDGPVIGYTGRHGYEKRLDVLLEAAAGLDVPVVLGGDGPAREELQAQAAESGVEAYFLGFLDRDELPAFYSTLDVFAFPSPVETQGLVALEANACGTPVAGVDNGALAETIEDGRNGYKAATTDAKAFRSAIERTLRDSDRLREVCLDRRSEISVDHSLDRLRSVYRQVLE